MVDDNVSGERGEEDEENMEALFVMTYQAKIFAREVRQACSVGVKHLCSPQMETTTCIYIKQNTILACPKTHKQTTQTIFG